jgi:hypothetical protein
VSDMYDEFTKVSQKFNDSKLKGKPDAILEQKYRLLADARKRLGALRDSGVEDTDAQAVGLARAALGQAPMTDFPYTPLQADVARIASKMARSSYPTRRMSRAAAADRAKEVRKGRSYANRWMHVHGLTSDQILRAYIRENRSKISNATMRRNVDLIRANLAR